VVELSRTVRFCLNGPGPDDAPAQHNTFAAWPPMRGLGRFYQLHVRCAGRVDPVTGYFMNIREIDQAVRAAVLPYLASLVSDESRSADAAMGAVMGRVVELLQPALHRSVLEVRLGLTPFYSLGIGADDMSHVTIRQQYEFSAAHRLHVHALSAQENREVFGKCNNPSGHGHNYRVEVAVRAPIDPAGRTLAVERLDGLVDREVIQRLDHKHLNVDVEQFADLNPSVENIAMVIHGLLADAVPTLGVELEEVSVWETGKTVCTYRGESSRTAEQQSSR
jgi:6-pyruvoyltetrahydropterin/6-carboxytetrahydropterin synthase